MSVVAPQLVGFSKFLIMWEFKNIKNVFKMFIISHTIKQIFYTFIFNNINVEKILKGGTYYTVFLWT